MAQYPIPGWPDGYFITDEMQVIGRRGRLLKLQKDGRVYAFSSSGFSACGRPSVLLARAKAAHAGTQPAEPAPAPGEPKGAEPAPEPEQPAAPAPAPAPAPEPPKREGPAPGPVQAVQPEVFPPFTPPPATEPWAPSAPQNQQHLLQQARDRELQLLAEAKEKELELLKAQFASLRQEITALLQRPASNPVSVPVLMPAQSKLTDLDHPTPPTGKPAARPKLKPRAIKRPRPFNGRRAALKAAAQNAPGAQAAERQRTPPGQTAASLKELDLLRKENESLRERLALIGVEW